MMYICYSLRAEPPIELAAEYEPCPTLNMVLYLCLRQPLPLSNLGLIGKVKNTKLHIHRVPWCMLIWEEARTQIQMSIGLDHATLAHLVPMGLQDCHLVVVVQARLAQ